MGNTIPQEALDLFAKKALAHVATLMADGTPQITPVWVDFDGTHIVINSARGRVKDRNMEARPQVGVEIMDPDNGYRYLSVRGRVVEITEDGADAHIDKMAMKYLNQPSYPYRNPSETRCIYRILPEHVHFVG